MKAARNAASETANASVEGNGIDDEDISTDAEGPEFYGSDDIRKQVLTHG